MAGKEKKSWFSIPQLRDKQKNRTKDINKAVEDAIRGRINDKNDFADGQDTNRPKAR